MDATQPPTLDPGHVYELVRHALAHPTVTAPGTAPFMAPEDVRQRILDTFVARGIGNTALEPYHPRASSAGGCVRALTYHRLGVPETDPLDPEVGLTLELGTLLHLYLDAVLVHSGLPVEIREHELRVPFAYGEITGHIDRGIGSCIVDYKSASRASFDIMVETNAPLASHRAQVTFYLHAARLAGLPYTHALIVAYCKDPGIGDRRIPWVSEPIAYDPELAHDTIRLFERVEEAARAGRLPERPYTIPHAYPCRGCRWRSACWNATGLRSETVADLGALAHDADRYKAMGREFAALKHEYEALGGRLKAALLDEKAMRALAGAWELSLSQYERVTIDPDDLPADLLQHPAVQRAMRRTQVTKLNVTAHKTAPSRRAHENVPLPHHPQRQ